MFISYGLCGLGIFNLYLTSTIWITYRIYF